jgi:hypothetical protein
MEKSDIERPEPGSLPPRISFIEQMGGSAGYYVRFKEVPEEDHPEEDHPEEGHPEEGHLEERGPIRKYIPILQYESQEEALQAAIRYRDRKAEELGVPTCPERTPHSEETKEKMSDYHNRMGLRGLGFTFDWENGKAYPQLRALWSEEEGQEKVTRAMTQRGIYASVEALAPYLQKHVHPSRTEEEITRRGAKGAARRLLQIKEDADPMTQKRKRIELLFERWASENPRDRELLEELLGTCPGR